VFLKQGLPYNPENFPQTSGAGIDIRSDMRNVMLFPFPPFSTNMARTVSTLESFLTEIAKLTGLRFCLYDLNYFTQDSAKLRVPVRLRTHCCAWCNLVKSNPVLYRRCIEVEHARLRKAGRRKAAIIDTCHAGVTDIVVPLFLGTRQIGALYLGQCRTGGWDGRSGGEDRKGGGEDQEEGKRPWEAITRHGLDPERLQEEYERLPHVMSVTLSGYKKLLSGIKEYIEQIEWSIEKETRFLDVRLSNSEKMSKVNVAEVPNLFLENLSAHTPAVQRTLALIARNYWSEVNLVKIARQAGVGRSHLSRQFHRETGITFRECVRGARIYAAQYLLKRTKLGNKEVAELLGYGESSSFIRAFKAHTKGATPHSFLRYQANPKPH
jgi:AraC-like DNA-binding protein